MSRVAGTTDRTWNPSKSIIAAFLFLAITSLLCPLSATAQNESIFDLLGVVESELRSSRGNLDCYMSDGVRLCEHQIDRYRKEVFSLENGRVTMASEVVFTTSSDAAYNTFQTLAAEFESAMGPPVVDGQVRETGSLNKVWQIGGRVLYLRSARNNSTGEYSVSVIFAQDAG